MSVILTKRTITFLLNPLNAMKTMTYDVGFNYCGIFPRSMYGDEKRSIVPAFFGLGILVYKQ
jgi:hypothetical protein